MKNLVPLSTVSLALFALGVSACTTTYTEADLRAEDVREDADARTEEARDREIGEEGGVNKEAEEEEADWVVRDSEL